MVKDNKTTDNAGDDDKEITYAKEEISKEEMALASESLVGDIRDVILDNFRARPKAWEQMSEAEQRDTVATATNAARNLTQKAVEIIARNGRKTVVAKLHDFKVDKEVITAKITARKTDETLLEFSASQGLAVMIVTSDAAEFEGERKGVEIDADQGDLEKNIAAKASKAKTSKAKPPELVRL